MTRTDQAFIEAYQRSQAAHASGATPAAPAEAAGTRMLQVHGPHVQWKEKTPLAEAIALRMRRAAQSESEKPQPAVVTSSFNWPGVAVQLSELYAAEYEGLAPPSTSATQAIGVAGVHRGSGATTTTLALAHRLAKSHGPVLVVDADPAGPGLAGSLGVYKTSSLADSLSAGRGPMDSVFCAEVDRVSLVVAGDIAPLQGERVAAAAQQLADYCPTILVDFGAVIDSRDAWQGGLCSRVSAAFNPAGVLLVRCDSDLTGSLSAAQRLVDSSGAPALGVIENRLTDAEV